MSYQALYRVWRPRQFKDLVGQLHITQTLQNAIEQKKFSHAYLFSGPRGTGKTSAAKIFAQAINCEQAPVREPCNECAACRGILDGSISDVIEIDAASNTSVDDIREIRDKVKYASSTVPYKVYIIDEVHMISVNAFNALLKTLEEPPSHVVFILATTEPHKIPVTIISRCQRFDFKPIGKHVIVERLKKITEAENIKISEEALDTIALMAEGGMRDALSMLDQAIAYSEGTVELSDVLAVTGGVSQQTLTTLVRAMNDQQVKQAIESFNDLIQQGKDPGRFVHDLIYFLRDLLFYKSASMLEDGLERARIDEEFKQLAEQVSTSWIQDAILKLNQCQQEIKWTTSPKIFIEVALLSITTRQSDHHQVDQNLSGQSTNTVSDESILSLTRRIEQLENEIKRLKTAPMPEKQEMPRRQAPRPSSGRGFTIPSGQIYSVLEQAEKQALKQVQEKWETFLSSLKSTNAPAHATIQDSKPVACSKDGLVVAFRYEIHCSLFMDNKELVETVLHDVMGHSLQIIPIPEKDWHTLRQEFLARKEPVEKKDEGNPVVDEAIKLFGDDIVEIVDE